MPSIGEIDKNLKIETQLDLPNVRFYDVRKDPFDLYGFYNPKNEPVFKRLPDDIARATNEGVATLYLHTAGGRVRFTTDSGYVAIKCKLPSIHLMSHMTPLGSSGFDLFVHENGQDFFHGSFFPPVDMTDGYESVLRFPDRKTRSFTIHFPLYNAVNDLYIGLEDDASLDHGPKYRYDKPVLFYGSSITQGGCATRPGNCYENILSAKMGLDHINLGFSGSARGEDVIVDYMAKLDFSVFVLDYDHNAPSVEHLQNTHEKLFLKIRETHPDTPVIIMTKPDFENGVEANIRRRDMIYRTYMNAINRGDKNVYYIDGERLLGNTWRDVCTVDGCHPNDVGFVRMAEAVGQVLEGIFRKMKSIS